MSENDDAKRIDELAEGNIVDDASKGPVSQTQEGDHEYVPWDKVGFITIGPKGVFVAPKGTEYPKPTPQAAAKQPEMEGAKLEDLGKLTEMVRNIEAKLKGMEAELADLKKCSTPVPKPEDEEDKKKKMKEDSEKPKAEPEKDKEEEKKVAEQEAPKTPAPPAAQTQQPESADHSVVSPWTSALSELRKQRVI